MEISIRKQVHYRRLCFKRLSFFFYANFSDYLDSFVRSMKYTWLDLYVLQL